MPVDICVKIAIPATRGHNGSEPAVSPRGRYYCTYKATITALWNLGLWPPRHYGHLATMTTSSLRSPHHYAHSPLRSPHRYGHLTITATHRYGHLTIMATSPLRSSHHYGHLTTTVTAAQITGDNERTSTRKRRYIIYTYIRYMYAYIWPHAHTLHTYIYTCIQKYKHTYVHTCAHMYIILYVLTLYILMIIKSYHLWSYIPMGILATNSS